MKEKLKRLACDPRALLWLWVLIAVSGMTRLGHGRENNFLIFKYAYWHVVGQQPLYEHYPAEYFDMNHYGPFFSLVIAPFALPPVWLLHALATGGHLLVLLPRAAQCHPDAAVQHCHRRHYRGQLLPHP